MSGNDVSGGGVTSQEGGEVISMEGDMSLEGNILTCDLTSDGGGWVTSRKKGASSNQRSRQA